MLSVAAEDDPSVPEKAISGLRGWVNCFEKASFAGSLFSGGITDPGEAANEEGRLEEVYLFGKSLNMTAK